MPTYEYRCPDGHVIERRFKMSEAASELTCPECGKIAVRQLSGGAGLVFKGSGFYLTDYGRNAHRGGAPDTSASRAAASGGEGSGESKSKDSDRGEKAPAESKPAESKSGESKSDSKSTEAKSAEPKSKETTAGAAQSSASTKSDT